MHLKHVRYYIYPIKWACRFFLHEHQICVQGAWLLSRTQLHPSQTSVSRGAAHWLRCIDVEAGTKGQCGQEATGLRQCSMTEKAGSCVMLADVVKQVFSVEI